MPGKAAGSPGLPRLPHARSNVSWAAGWRGAPLPSESEPGPHSGDLTHLGNRGRLPGGQTADPGQGGGDSSNPRLPI